MSCTSILRQSLPLTGKPAVDVQLVLVVAGDVHLGQLGVFGGKRFAEVAVAHRHFIFGMRGRPNPIGADQLEEGGAGFRVGFFQNGWLGGRLCRSVCRAVLGVRRCRSPSGGLPLRGHLGRAAAGRTLSLCRGITRKNLQPRQTACKKNGQAQAQKAS